MRAKVAGLCLSLVLGTAFCSAQTAPQSIPVSSSPQFPTATQPDYTAVYCSGFMSDQMISQELRLVSAEQSNYKFTFARGDYVHINHGSSQGVRVGDRFSVVRQERDPMKVSWFKWQTKLIKAMGAHYLDLGQLRVVNVQPNVSVAEITFSCGPMQRGDILRPYQDRVVAPYKPASQFDHFAPVSGKPVAMVVAAKDNQQVFGKNSTVYVNLGSGQGVKVGDYYRIFRYQGSHAETAPQTKDYQYKMFGFGSAPKRYQWNDLPREVLGEGIVFDVSKNSSTMLVTFTTIEVFAGDYVEIE
jgi:hypothetical protein